MKNFMAICLFTLLSTFYTPSYAVHSPVEQQTIQQSFTFDVHGNMVQEKVKPDPRKRKKKKKGKFSDKLKRGLIYTGFGALGSLVLAIASFIGALFAGAEGLLLVLIIAFYVFWFLAILLGITALVFLILYLVERAKENE